MKSVFTMLAILAISMTGNAQAVGIGTVTPNSSAMLDITSNNRGMLVPRVSLTSLSDAATIASPATSLLVYNTNAAVTGGVGFYYNSGTPASPVWLKFQTGVASGNFWSVTGNAGIDSANNFIGTTDGKPLMFRVNNQYAGRLGTDGIIALGRATLQSNTSGVGNSAIADSSLILNTIGNYNTGFGFKALKNNISGSYNTAVGSFALDSNTNLYNTAIGYKSLQNNSSGQSNTGIGAFAIGRNRTGSSNTAIGSSALQQNLYGTQNISIGTSSMVENTNGSRNIAIGVDALREQFYAGSGAPWNSDNVAIGYQSLFLNQPTGTLNGVRNTALGNFSMRNNSTGKENVASGYEALFNNTTGTSNVAVGFASLKANIGGTENTAIGHTALTYNNSGYHNTAIGSISLNNNTSGAGNSALGVASLFTNMTGNFNTGIGEQALYENISGNNNTALGLSALYSNIAGNNATAVGYNALQYANNSAVSFTNTNVAVGYEAIRGSLSPDLNIGNANTAIGYQALLENTSGNSNSAVGYLALTNNNSGDYNTAVGRIALTNNTTGNGNVAIGYSAGSSRLASNNCTYVGNDAENSSGIDYDNSTALGYQSRITASNQMRLGNNSITSFYCQGAYAATTALGANLYVSSTGQIMRSTSSARYKKNVSDLDINSSLIYKLRPVSYNSKTDDSRHFGLIAEEVAAVIPELAEYAKEKDVIPGSTSEKLIPDAVQYSLLSVLLLKEMQQQQKIIQKVNAKLLFLEEENKVLKSSQALSKNTVTEIDMLKQSLEHQQKQIDEMKTLLKQKVK
ncbi:MAG TPA: tail fiber domain-containing protein [Ferruginibacter sp.]|nr:tail fiber domain-containing protein [Ferruginibacter sp.]